MLRAAIALVILGIVFIPLEKPRLVRRGQRAGRYGIDEPMPPGYLRQLQSPFVLPPLVEVS